MDGAATVTELGRDGLGLVDRRLGALELLAVLHHDPRLGQLRFQRLRVRLGHGGWRRTPNERPVRGSSRDHGSTEQEG